MGLPFALLLPRSPLVRPAGPGWGPIRAKSAVPPAANALPQAMLGWVLGVSFVYSALFGTGGVLFALFIAGRVRDKEALRATNAAMLLLTSVVRLTLFGAAGQGDIGRHFSNTDPRWKDAPGLDLLARAVTIVAEAGYRPASADVTIILEQPKLAPHIDAIRARVAEVLGVTVDAVSVKGKTNEGVDAVGRGEAIAAHAVAVLTGRTA